MHAGCVEPVTSLSATAPVINAVCLTEFIPDHQRDALSNLEALPFYLASKWENGFYG
jgi:hypothetical protein